ncbi:hypothetical protein J3458_005820 [Metarhizium acridum]|uniref:uncharacterized protein n=1 Tax=Metarhizium acridum TaxID=92637 RepID=UPI001C6C077A|nr:hypothetical protein J3458_005820 [Metarhizium acridum]
MTSILSFLCVLSSIFLVVSADFVVVEHLDQPPYGWTKLGAANSSQLIRLSIALESQGRDVFERTLQEVSDPTHARYGQYLSRDEAVALVRPRSRSVAAVRKWLLSENVTQDQVQERGLFVDAVMTIGTAENLLSTTYGVFQHDKQRAIGALAYSVPAEVRPHIISIQPTTFFELGNLFKKSPQTSGLGIATGHGRNTGVEARSTELRDCENHNTPECLRGLYKMNNDYAKPHKKSLLGVAGFDGQAAQYDQLEKYLDTYAPYAKGASFSVELINNGTNPQGEYPGAEANMDIQIAVSMAFRVPVRFYSTGGEDHGFIPDLDISDPNNQYIEPWLQFVSYLLDLPDRDLPQVMSISYGVNEQAVPKPYALRICQIFGLLTLRGMSIIMASGDQGPGVSCQSNDGTDTTKFLPAFPAGCPYVTAVGATEQNYPERAVNFSSGGFSEYWPRPAWQEAAVSRYLAAHGERWNGYYNKAGRGFPDVSAQGIGYPFFNHGRNRDGGGTR